MRDPRNLKAFGLADRLVMEVYRLTGRMPAEERFGLTTQIQRSVVSIASNIVEGCARHSEADYLRFLDMALGSACELEYQLSVAARLGFLGGEDHHRGVLALAAQTAKTLNALIRSLRAKA